MPDFPNRLAATPEHSRRVQAKTLAQRYPAQQAGLKAMGQYRGATGGLIQRSAGSFTDGE
jgi:hypothetical protein